MIKLPFNSLIFYMFLYFYNYTTQYACQSLPQPLLLPPQYSCVCKYGEALPAHSPHPFSYRHVLQSSQYPPRSGASTWQITESQNGLGWKGPQSPPRPNPCHGQGYLPPAQAAQGPIQPGLEHLQLLWAAVSASHCPLGKEFPHNS